MVTQQPRPNRGAETLAGCIAVVALLPFEAWLLMLVLGAVHGVAAVVPAVGFGTAVLFVVGLNMITGYVGKIAGRRRR